MDAALPTFKIDDYVYRFEENFPRHPNTLFATKDKQLFLADVEEGKIEDLHEVSLVEALEWYSQCVVFSTCSSGEVSLLCEMAAKQLSTKEVA